MLPKGKKDRAEKRDVFSKIAATSPGLIYSMRQNGDVRSVIPMRVLR
jgi:hypothetical protein